MCTTIAKNTDGLLFGRNMDIERSFGERLIIAPRNYSLKYKCEKENSDHFAFMGIGTVIDGYPLYAEGVNEKGLCVAGLNFVGNAFYNSYRGEGANLAPYELIPKILSECESLKDAVALLEKTNLVSIPFRDDIPLSRLHFHIADKTGSAVFETTKNGRKIYKNPVDVLTNNPPFPYHLTNLSNYENLKNHTPDAAFSSDAPYSMGLGAIGLPGDYSSMSRFVRAVFLKHYSEWDKCDRVAQMLHILNAVAVPIGAVLTDDGEAHYTTYQCCIDAENCIYYYRTYNSLNTSRIEMKSFDLNGDLLTEINLR